MGLLTKLIIKGATTMAVKSTIKTAGEVAVNVIGAKAKSQALKEDAVVKKGKLYIKPTRSSENYIKQSTIDVVQELFGAGFENITIKSVKKLSEHSIKKYGKVYSISINGETSFSYLKKYPASAYIVVEYYDFKSGVSRDVYNKVDKLQPGKVSSAFSLESHITRKEDDIQKRFCISCGEQISNPAAMFCSACGKKL